MNKQIIALAATAAFAAPAFRADSVTLYGVIDEGINYTNSVGGHSVVELQSGYAQGSRGA
jgi:predicted porin